MTKSSTRLASSRKRPQRYLRSKQTKEEKEADQRAYFRYRDRVQPNSVTERIPPVRDLTQDQ